MAKADPERSCLGCRKVSPKKDLLRYVIDPEGTLVPDLLQKLPGRGAYTCFESSCLEGAFKKKQFSRAFKAEIRHPEHNEFSELVVKLLVERILSILSLSNKAGKVVSGSDTVMDALRKGSISLLVLSSDISPDSAAKFMALSGKTGVEIFRFSSKDQLGSILGKEMRSAVAVISGDFAERLRKELTRYRNFFQGGA